jgi:hypothetical protein
MAARHVEAFRDNPMAIATHCAAECTKTPLLLDDNKVFLYLVDEFNGVPCCTRVTMTAYSS